MTRPTKIAIIGCGYVASSYCDALQHHPELSLVALVDRVTERCEAFAARWPTPTYSSVAEMIARSEAEIALNLTNPRDHVEITKTCLEAGLHVYSEKPLAMESSEAKALVDFAAARGLMLMTAPCSLLSETATTVADAISSGVIGQVRLVLANFDDGLIAPGQSPWTWHNSVGIPWPAKDEFEVGCTYEHAGYVLTWLARILGPARQVTAFAATLIEEKGIQVEDMAPDFTTGCIEYDGGVVARISCSLVAPRDKSITFIGDDGILKVGNVRHERCPIRYRLYRSTRWRSTLENKVGEALAKLGKPELPEGWASWKTWPYSETPPSWMKSGRKLVDFMRGPAEMAAALRENRPCKVPAEVGWHVTELIEALQYPPCGGGRTVLSSGFAFSPALNRTIRSLEAADHGQ